MNSSILTSSILAGNKNGASYRNKAYKNVYISWSSSGCITALQKKKNRGIAQSGWISLSRYDCAFTNNIHQMAQGNKLLSGLVQTVLWP